MSYSKIALITICVAVILFIAGMTHIIVFDGEPTTVAEEVPCENNKVLLVFEDGELVARYAGINSIHSGVFVGYGGKMVVQMRQCEGGIKVVGTTFIADNQSFQLVDE